ncbi:hypothetical protein CXF85_12415 [Colwellia sp. 75C3]|uniref:hypothetical protein n=1 Tax=Colwellia sp. 75C3 TaxID=888425 RepID=UPI000C33E232|nr:hypothetical protein [Colwellia sp. 75C3]PKG82729.1 hypothetical protein CXF85_12415 [Colwellia sp. 75C3]
MKKTAYIFSLLASLLSNPLFAHPGHGHSTGGAGLAHLLWLVPVIVAAVVVVFKEITASKN